MIFVQTLWAALTSRLAGYIGTASAIALAVTLGVTVLKADIVEGGLRHDKAVAEASERLAQTNLNTCHASLKAEGDSLDRQTAAVGALQAESTARSSAASVAVQRARVATAALSEQEAKVAALEATPDQCASTASILMGNVQ